MKENKVRHRLANVKAARTAWPKNSRGVVLLEQILLDNVWKFFIGAFIFFIFLLIILTYDE